MGKPTGFMEFERINKPEVDVLKRIEVAYFFYCVDKWEVMHILSTFPS